MKELRIHWLARREISGAYLYYHNLENPALAVDLEARLRVAFEEISRHSTRFSIWRETRVRKFFLKRFPYVIFYLEYPDFIRILAVAHTSRRPGYWRARIAVD